MQKTPPAEPPKNIDTCIEFAENKLRHWNAELIKHKLTRQTPPHIIEFNQHMADSYESMLYYLKKLRSLRATLNNVKQANLFNQ